MIRGKPRQRAGAGVCHFVMAAMLKLDSKPGVTVTLLIHPIQAKHLQANHLTVYFTRSLEKMGVEP